MPTCQIRHERHELPKPQIGARPPAGPAPVTAAREGDVRLRQSMDLSVSQVHASDPFSPPAPASVDGDRHGPLRPSALPWAESDLEERDHRG
jgi:hypothetical protein